MTQLDGLDDRALTLAADTTAYGSTYYKVRIDGETVGEVAASADDLGGWVARTTGAYGEERVPDAAGEMRIGKFGDAVEAVVAAVDEPAVFRDSLDAIAAEDQQYVPSDLNIETSRPYAAMPDTDLAAERDRLARGLDARQADLRAHERAATADRSAGGAVQDKPMGPVRTRGDAQQRDQSRDVRVAGKELRTVDAELRLRELHPELGAAAAMKPEATVGLSSADRVNTALGPNRAPSVDQVAARAAEQTGARAMAQQQAAARNTIGRGMRAR